MRRIGSAAVAAVLLAGVTATAARAQLPGEVTVNVGMYLQVESQYSTLGTAAEGRHRIQVNRARPIFELTLDDWITAELVPDFGKGDVRLRDAWIRFAFDDAANVRVGHFKKPFGLIERTSSSMLPVIQRGTEILGLRERIATRTGPVTLPDGTTLMGDPQAIMEAMNYLDFGMGVAVEGQTGRLEYVAGLFEGPAGSAGRKGASARAALMVLPGLKLGAAVSHSQIRFVEDEDERKGTAGSVEVAWNEPGWPGFGVLAEVMRGRGVGSGTDVAGGHVIGWLHRGIGGRVSGIEPVVRVSWGDPDTDAPDDGGTLVTAGFNVYFGGRNRLMFDVDVYSSQHDAVGTEAALRAVAQVRF